jgi:capsular exopolysaccharide synthesis family protein
MVAGGIAFVLHYLDDSIRDPDAVQEVAGLSTLGTIARMRGDRDRSEIYRLATLLYPRSSIAEAYRALRTNIEFSSVDAPIRTLLVTSSIPGEGKTTTAANLAVVFAQAGRRVLLLDADLRKPGVHLVFDLPNSHGLTALLRDDQKHVDTIAQATDQDNLRVLTTGSLPPNPAELLGSQRMRTTLARLSASFDLVIVDSPPLQAVTDSAILSSVVDATLLVIDAGRSRRSAVRLACESLAKSGTTVLGVALNRAPDRAHSNYTGYYGEYGGTEDVAHKRAQGADKASQETGLRP